VLLLVGNPAVLEPGFAAEVDLALAGRPDLDIIWQGSPDFDAPPTAGAKLSYVIICIGF
jgi:hypothetical protein